jgi:hypothetical protein
MFRHRYALSWRPRFFVQQLRVGPLHLDKPFVSLSARFSAGYTSNAVGIKR